MKIPPFIYLDRYRNEGTRTYSAHSGYSEALQEYQPTAAKDTFALKVFAVPKDQVNIYTANPPQELEKTYLSEKECLFCVHPQVVTHCPQDPYLVAVQRQGRMMPDVTVIPSSSTRTLYSNATTFHALKVHFPFRVSRYERRMRDEVIEQAINVSRDIEKNIEDFDKDFAFLREVLGISAIAQETTTARTENWGYLVRDMEPFPKNVKQSHLVPGFALYGKDLHDSSVAPLLFTLLEKRDPVQTIVENIMQPIISHWLHCYTSLGYILEPHGQNILLEIDNDATIRRIVHRDLSTGIDMRLRNDLRLCSQHLNNYNKMSSGEFCSIAYDMFMGSHFFDRIISCCQQRFPKLCPEDFKAPCRKHFAALFPEYKTYFPKDVYYFSEQRDQFNKPLYTNTETQPSWRP